MFLTLEEVLLDVASSPGFESVDVVGVNSCSSSGETPLHWMAFLGDVAGTSILLEAGANINAVNNKGNTPLHEATACRQVPVIKLLIGCGASTRIKNMAGFTALELAVVDGYEPSVEILKAVL